MTKKRQKGRFFLVILFLVIGMYIEKIFILNFLLDFMILYGTKRILKISCKYYRLVFGALVGAFSTFFLFWHLSSGQLLIYKLLISVFMILCCFGIKDFFNSFFYFYVLSILLGGLIYLFSLNAYTISYIGLIVSCVFMLWMFIGKLFLYRVKYSDKYLVSIVISGKCYELEGFIDTGNQLRSPYKGEAVILVNLELSMSNCLFIPYKALNTTGVIPCVKPDKVMINHIEFHNCLIGISHDKFQLNGVNCILPNRFKEDLC